MGMHDPTRHRFPSVPDELYQHFIGPYAFASGRQILVTRRGLGEEALYFYLEGDALVRLFPRSTTQWVTDRQETFTFSDELASASLDMQDSQGQVWQAQRVHSYEEESVQIVGNDRSTLAGSLLTPPGPGPHPAVVLYHLANVHERDYYRIYAHQFVQQGIAALIYPTRWATSHPNL